MFLSLSNIESSVSKFISKGKTLFSVYISLFICQISSIRCFSCKFEIIWFQNFASKSTTLDISLAVFQIFRKPIAQNTYQEIHSFVRLFDSFDAVEPYVLIKATHVKQLFSIILQLASMQSESVTRRCSVQKLQ